MRLDMACTILMLAPYTVTGAGDADLAVVRNACVNFVCTNSSVYSIYGNACLGLNMSLRRDCRRLCPTFVSLNRNCDKWGLSCVQACMAGQKKLGFPLTTPIDD
ncbi:hypothetical protein H310_12763 [Aphanomyces invadans]|uniref:Uncharacterized protein n=1 Tax=Aphanomyces invadans TaxID=157072 RepID=A0A024TGL7_9STRA|nr:hypothetical protein H310_12763 [Aphanomyces invadans]ETV93154.1 hypothetical protein H310_12763 [Aphanomyces invadans]|eukprot:XP_008878176.1 hypothetical protein H310_12763 [Aphanomyces invadans]